MQRIAVTSQNFRTVTGHAGKTRRFIVYGEQDGAPVELERLDLPMEQSFHELRGAPHPLDGSSVLITSGCSENFVHNIAKRGIRVCMVDAETTPLAAASAWLAGSLQALPVPAGLSQEDDHHHHDHHQHRHQHRHGQGHGHGPHHEHHEHHDDHPCCGHGHDEQADA